MKGRPSHVWVDMEDRSLVHGYLNDEDMVSMSKRLKISRSSLYRRLSILGIPAREPRKGSQPRHYSIKSYEKANPLVQELFEKARQEYATLTWLATRSGICRETIGGWGKGATPLIANLEAVGNCLSLKLAWKEIE